MGVVLNAYYGIGDEIIVVWVHSAAMFVHGSTCTLYFYNVDVAAFVNAFSEEYLSFWTEKTRALAADVTPPSG